MHEAIISHLSYQIRNYQARDFNAYTELVSLAEKIEPRGRCVLPEFIAEHLYYPEQNLFIVEIRGELIGYMNVWPELTIHRLILDCWIHPDHRKKGLATKLLECVELMAGRRRVVAHVNIPENDTVAKIILPKMGFKSVRRYLEMNIEIDRVNWECPNKDDFECRCMRSGEESKLANIQNRAFAGTWGYNPNTVEEITYRTNMLNNSPEDVILIYKGNNVVGYCWTRIIYTEKINSGEKKGQVFMLGVDDDYRGESIGRRVLLAGIDCLKNKGFQSVDLIVDSENEVACKLYQSVGFKVKASSLWYEKLIG